jgi:hypothetical protein
MLNADGLAEGDELGSNVLRCRNDASAAAKISKESSRGATSQNYKETAKEPAIGGLLRFWAYKPWGQGGSLGKTQ